MIKLEGRNGSGAYQPSFLWLDMPLKTDIIFCFTYTMSLQHLVK